MKTFLLIVFIAILGAFIYLKFEVSGSPNSSFNQSARFTLGKHPLLRTILGLHNPGDARAEYLEGAGPITIEWFAPEDQNIDQSVLSQFSSLVGKYTGRPTQVQFGANLDESTINVSNLASYGLKAAAQQPSGTTLLVFFTQDYSPRASNELSNTYRESGMVLSLNAQMSLVQNSQQELDQYLLSSMLYEFGSQIGLPVTPADSQGCVMSFYAALNSAPLGTALLSAPQDFCQAEQTEIRNLKLQYQ
jgi:hypothetical protein